MPRQNNSATRNRRRRRVVGARDDTRGFDRSPRRLVKAPRRTLFALYAPRLALTRLKSKEYWRATRPKILAAFLIVVFASALYQLFAGDQFYVPQLALSGNHVLPAAEIEQAAGIRGWNIFFVNLQDVETAIKKLPEVKDARVTIGLPNRVEVQIVERAPRFIWQTRSGTYWVDDDGIALRVRFNSPDLLTLKDYDSTGTKIGSRVNAEAFNAAVNLRNMWKDGPRAFEWTKAHGLTTRDSHGWLIYFGSANQMANKLDALKIVTAQLVKDQHTIAYIDVGSGLPYYQEIAKKE